MRKLSFLLVIWSASYFFATASLYASPLVQWQSFAPQFEFTSVTPEVSGFFDNPLSILRVSPTRYRIAVIRAPEFGMHRATAKELCRASGARACINANFFDEKGDPLGLVVSRGSQYQKLHAGGRTLTGIFQVTRHAFSILSRSTYQPGAVLEAVQAGPRLVVARAPVQGLGPERSGRSAICIDAKGRVLLFSASSGFRGITFQELQQTMLLEQIGCIDALNLDGGSSAQMYVSFPGQTPLEVNGFDQVPVVLGIFDGSDEN